MNVSNKAGIKSRASLSSRRAALLKLRLFAAAAVSLFFLDSCGSGLPGGRLNPLPIDIIRDEPEGDTPRRRYYGGGGRRGRGGSGGDDNGELSPKERWEAKCAEVSAAAGRGDYGAIAGLLSRDDPAMQALTEARQAGDYNRLSSLLNSLFAPGTPCRVPLPAPPLAGPAPPAPSGPLGPCTAATTARCPYSPPPECKMADVTFVQRNNSALSGGSADRLYVRSGGFTFLSFGVFPASGSISPSTAKILMIQDPHPGNALSAVYLNPGDFPNIRNSTPRAYIYIDSSRRRISRITRNTGVTGDDHIRLEFTGGIDLGARAIHLAYEDSSDNCHWLRP